MASPNPWLFLTSSIPAICFGLGTWQYYRWKSKLAMLSAIDQAWHESIEKISSWELLKNNLKVGRRYQLAGTWLKSSDVNKVILVGPRRGEYQGQSTIGSDVIYILQQKDDRVLWYEGWKSQDQIQSLFNKKESQQITSPIVYMKKGEQSNLFRPDNEPERGKWYWINIDQMSRYYHTDPILLASWHEQTPSPRHALPNNHVQYMITWYSLGLLTSLLLYQRLRRKR